jgi:V/A-type H+-transporting ATPase subunit B
MGQILRARDDICVVQVFDGTMGLGTENTTVWLERDVMRVGVGDCLRGQILSGRGRPLDGANLSGFEAHLPIGGPPINPARRASPGVALETGISSLDLMNTLARGQNLSIVAGPGLPAADLAIRIARQTTVFDRAGAVEDSEFFLVFAAMGITNREANSFMDAFRDGDDIPANGVFLLNTAGDPVAERLLTPRIALTIAEYFAFAKGYDVLVVMTDMLHYCEALREIGAAWGVPGRGYPDGMYSDLAEIYERAGCIAGRRGSVTQLSIVGMPNDDMTHPVVDLSGYLTEGRIVLDRRLHEKGIFPPVDVLSSLSRPMNGCIGRGRTFDSHGALADQLCAACAKAGDLRRLRPAVDDDRLNDVEKRYLLFGERFEKIFLDQKEKRRTLAESENAAWEALSVLPASELYRLPRALRERRLKG